MNPAKTLVLAALAAAAAAAAGSGFRLQGTPAPPVAGEPAREDAYRANNRGVALLEQFRPQDAAEAFREALRIDPGLAIARVNLAIALFNVPDLAQARSEAEAAARAAPEAPQPRYVLGLIARSENRTDDARAAFEKVLSIDPADVGALVNLGQLHMQQRQYPDAVAGFRSAVAAEPYNATAVYNLGLALTRSGQTAEAQQTMERFRQLREGGYGTLLGQNYPDQGRYAEAVASTGAEPDLVDAATPPVRFTDASARRLPAPGSRPASPPAIAFGRTFEGGRWDDAARAALVAGLGGRPTLFDLEGDGDLDLHVVGPEGQRLYRNDGGRFTDVTRVWGLDPAAAGLGAVAADYDNDEKPDLFVLRPAGRATLHRNTGTAFADVTEAAGIPVDSGLYAAAAFVDADHDGDVDLVLGGLADLRAGPAAGGAFPAGFPVAPSVLLQNDGKGAFKDVSAAAGIGDLGRIVALLPTDYDNRRDVDLLALPHGDAPKLLRNLRDGTFRDAAAEVGLTGSAPYHALAAADLNKDGFTDIFLGAEGAGRLLLSDGRGRFVEGTPPEGALNATAALFLDYDNDGLVDILVVSSNGPRLFRNVGKGWSDVSGAALPAGAGDLAGASLAAGDLDGDGDQDLVFRTRAGGLRVWENQGGDRNRSLRVRLAGLVSNRSGVGAKVEARAGSLRQRLETYATTPAVAPADIVFGLGRRKVADAVRVLWPAGVLQTEMTDAAGDARQAFLVKELDRKPSSCPYLYAWNGRRFEFVTDFMGGGEMGYWHGPGVWNVPDPDEYVRLRDDQLVPRDGRYEVRVTNELEEGLFVDRLALLAVAHPAGVEVFPDEGLSGPARKGLKLVATKGARPPRAATDDHGHDVLPLIERIDRRYPDDFRLLGIRGYAEDHGLNLDLGDDAPDAARVLLTGWTDYAFSSDNVAAHQAGLAMKPPQVQVRDAAGEWRTVADLPIPVGRPQTVIADLAGKWLSRSRQVRIVTNMRIYWDQVRVDVSASPAPYEPVWLDPVRATLSERGFSAQVSPDGKEPYSYAYERVSWDSPWKVFPGRYTRVGDVRELVLETDDRFVISRPGDEIALSFDAARLPPLPTGWRRTFLFFADGYSKEMDVNSATPYSLEPLPFHAMSRYPYEPPEAFPMTPERREWMERYNTRLVSAPIPPLELALEAAREGRRGGDGAARVPGGR